MNSTEGWSGTLMSWSEFILFHVLPIAVSQIFDWIREWQILVAVFLVLIFFQIWSHAILRAARRAAKETVQTETRAVEASLKLLRRQIEQRPAPRMQAPVAAQAAPPAAPLVPVDSRAAVDDLRQAIRLALGSIPVSDDPLSETGSRLYRAAIGSMGGIGTDLKPGDRLGGLEPVLTELAALERSFPPQSCRQAWQALVKVNALAREFHDPTTARADVPGTLAEAAQTTT